MTKNNEWAPNYNPKVAHESFFTPSGNLKESVFAEKDEDEKLLWELDHFNKPHAMMKTEDGKKVELVYEAEKEWHRTVLNGYVPGLGKKRIVA
jgi:hypothetical protein